MSELYTKHIDCQAAATAAGAASANNSDADNRLLRSDHWHM
jgi:hypothetical protein